MIQGPALTAVEAQVIAQEAYIYFYPLVIMDISRKHFTNIEAGKMFARGPMNTFSHARTFPPATFQGATHANFDTLYSVGWLDLTREPVVISVPNTQGRYYLLQLLDMWTDSFAGVGKRTTGTGPGDFAVVGPGWRGDLPQGIQRITAPTPFVWVIGRTRTDGPEDYDAVHKVQDDYKMTLLSLWDKPPQAIAVKIDSAVDMKTPPVKQVEQMSPDIYFPYAVELLNANGPHLTDQPILARIKRLGIEAGQSFDPIKVDPVVRKALQTAAAAAQKALVTEWPKVGRSANGWVMNTDSGVYGTNYLKRAAVAMFEIGMNLPEDSIYPDTASTPRSRGLGLTALSILLIAVLAAATGFAIAQTPPASTSTPAPQAAPIPPDQLASLVAPPSHSIPIPFSPRYSRLRPTPVELQQWLTKNPGLEDKALSDAVRDMQSFNPDKSWTPLPE